MCCTGASKGLSSLWAFATARRIFFWSTASRSRVFITLNSTERVAAVGRPSRRGVIVNHASNLAPFQTQEVIHGFRDEFCEEYLRDLGTSGFIQCELTPPSFLLRQSLCLPQPCPSIVIAEKLLTPTSVVVGALVEEVRFEGCGVNALVSPSWPLL